jgi:superfamily II DNA/RNA helicase
VFEDLNLDRRLQLGIDALQHTGPTEVQQRVVPAALAGDDLLASAATGSGKTLAYLIPVAEKILASKACDRAGTLALVLVPTRELARQVATVCDQLCARSPLRAQAITGGVDLKYQKSLLRKDPEVVVATPGRLLEHLQAGSADLDTLQTLVLDEADRMLDMGLRDDVLAIAQRCESQPQVLLVSATLTHPGVKALAGTLLNSPRKILVGREREALGAVRHQLILADSQQHKDKLISALLTREGLRRALVFCNRRKTAERLAALLGRQHLRCACLHGELSTEQRKRVLQQFREDKVSVVCATDVAARGLDVKDIQTVINYDIPDSGDDYVHRTGRTGRAGAAGEAISLAAASDWRRVAGIERYLSLEFERRSLPGLKARYDGPRAAAGDNESGKQGRKKASRAASSTAKTGKRPQRGKRPAATSNDGFGPLKKKQP